MFGFGKKKKEEKKKSSIDKLVMGAIVGGAIGSVIGMSIAPHKGKETREFLSQKGKEMLKKGQAISDKIMEGHRKGEGTATGKSKKTGKFFSRIKARIFGKKNNYRKIPNEVE